MDSPLKSKPQQAKEIFVKLIASTISGDWDCRLDESCFGDQELRNRVSALLEAHIRPGSFLEQPVVVTTSSFAKFYQPETEAIGTYIGHYKLIEQIGEGGMGTAKVYQYDNAVALASGSKAANSSWALAAGNTNPQGIADPPPSSAASPVGKTLGLQSPSVEPVPMPVFSGAPSTTASVSLQQVQSKVRSTDDFMSALGLAWEQPKASVSVGRMTTLASAKPNDRSARVEAEIQDDNIEDLISLVFHDLWR